MTAAHDRWAVRGGHLEAILAAQDSEVLPVSGDTPKLEVHWDGDDVAPGTFASFEISQAQDAIASTIAEQNDVQERLPVSARPLTGTSAGAATASGTLSSSGTNFAFDDQLIVLWQIPPPRFDDEGVSLQAAAQGEDIPHGARPLTGQADGAGTASATLSIAGTRFDIPDDVGPYIPPNLEAYGGEELDLPHSARSLTGTANGVGTATGTLAIAGTRFDAPDEVAQFLEPNLEAYGGEEPVRAPSALPLTGQANGVGTATAVLSIAGTNFDGSVELEAAYIAPDLQPDFPVWMAIQDSEEIPISGALVVIEFPPTDEDYAWLIGPYLDGYGGDEIDPVIGAKSLSGTANGIGTCSATPSIAGTNFAVELDAVFIPPDLAADVATAQAIGDSETIPISTVTPVGDQPPPEDDSAAIALTIASSTEAFGGPESIVAINALAMAGEADGSATAAGTLSGTTPTPPTPPTPPPAPIVGEPGGPMRQVPYPPRSAPERRGGPQAMHGRANGRGIADGQPSCYKGRKLRSIAAAGHATARGTLSIRLDPQGDDWLVTGPTGPMTDEQEALWLLGL